MSLIIMDHLKISLTKQHLSRKHIEKEKVSNSTDSEIYVSWLIILYRLSKKCVCSHRVHTKFNNYLLHSFSHNPQVLYNWTQHSKQFLYFFYKIYKLTHLINMHHVVWALCALMNAHLNQSKFMIFNSYNILIIVVFVRVFKININISVSQYFKIILWSIFNRGLHNVDILVFCLQLQENCI